MAGPTTTLRDLTALLKPSITGLSVFMAAGGLWLASSSHPGGDPLLILGALIGTALAVGSANALNMVLERDGDRLMARTASRPLPDGRLAVGPALAFGVIVGVGGLATLLWTTNALTMWLGAAALVSYVGIYTPLKRRTPLALLIGAVPGAAPPLMGWTAVTGTLDGPGVALFGVLLIWQIPHFLAISLFRMEDYARAGIRTVPVVRGERVAKLQALAWSTALLPCSLALIPLGAAGWLYLVVALGAGIWFWSFAARGLAAGAGVPWARRVFGASLVYLPVLVVGLAVDRLLL